MRASIRVFEPCSHVVFVGSPLPCTCLLNTVIRHTVNVSGLDLPLYATHPTNIVIWHTCASIWHLYHWVPLLVWPLRDARYEGPAAMEIDRWHGHPNMAKYEIKDLVDLLHSCSIG